MTKEVCTRRHAGVCLLLILIASSATAAADWPEFRGPDRDGKSSETELLDHWGTAGPRHVWTVDGLGEGWSSAAIRGRDVYTTGMHERKEFLFAIDDAGRLRWKKEYGSAWRRSFPGARTTPTLDDGRVYVISGSGEVVCLDGRSGRIAWKVDGIEKFKGRTGNWGTAESPLVDGGKIYYTPCGPQTTIVALDKKTGETVWASRSLNDQSAYVSPIVADHNGRKLILTVTGRYVIGVDAGTGRILWNYPYAENHPTAESENRLHINAVSPLYHEGCVFATSGYDHVAVMLQLSPDGDTVQPRWVNEAFDCHHGGVVLVDGHIYGTNWQSNTRGDWLCVDWQTGGTVYEQNWQGNKGPMVFADGMLYCYDENEGDVALVKASPEGFQPVSTFEVTLGKGKHWAHPSIAGGRLYLRHGEFLMAYDIEGE